MVLATTKDAAWEKAGGDFHALLMTVQESDKTLSGNDKFQGIYGSGGFVAQSYYFGIRRAPYSTDFKWNCFDL